MPEQVAERAAAALLADAVPRRPVSGGRDGSALRRLRFYLRRDIDVDGSTLYRLFHQGLADQLRADAAEDATAGNPSPAAQVWQHLYAMIPVEPGGSRQWQHAAPYLLRHAAQHADAAGHLEDLLQDTGFLIRADPDTLAPLVAALPAAAAGGAADTYRASYAAHVREAPSSPRADHGHRCRTLPAHRPGPAPVPGSYLAASLGEQPEQVGQSSHDPYRSHRRVTAVAVGRAGDREMIVSGGPRRHGAGLGRGDRGAGRRAAGRPRRRGERGGGGAGRGPRHDRLRQRDGTVRVWDAVDRAPVGLPLAGHTGGVTAVAVGRAGDRDVIVSGSRDGTVRVWDAVTGAAVGEPLAGHTGAVTAVAVGRAGDRDIIVSGSGDGTVRVWDAVTGQPVGRAAGRPHRRGDRGGGGAGRGPRHHRLRQQRRYGAGMGRGHRQQPVGRRWPATAAR